MKWLDSVVIRGHKPLRSLALLVSWSVVVLVAALYVYLSASGNALVTFQDVGYEYWIVLPIILALFCIIGIACPQSVEKDYWDHEPVQEGPGGTYVLLAFALAAAVGTGYMAGFLYFGAPVLRDVAYKTKDGKVYRGENIHARYFVTGFGTPEIIPVVKGRAALLGFSVSYTVSDEWLENKGADFNDMINQAVRETFGEIAAEKSRSKRLAFLAEFRKETERGENRMLAHFCGKLPKPCPFSYLYMSETDTPDVARNLWSKSYTAREALDEEHVGIAISLIRPTLEQNERNELFELILKKGTAEDIMSMLKSVPLDHVLYDKFVERVLTEELKGQSLVMLGSGKLLPRHQDRMRARKRMLEEAPSEALSIGNGQKVRMSVDEVNDYGERLLSGKSTASDRAWFLALYHDQIRGSRALRLADAIETSDAYPLIRLLSEDLMDEDLRQKIVEAVSKAQDSAIVKSILVDRKNHRTNRELSKPEMNQIIAGFLKNAHDEKWFDAITNYGGSAINKTQAQGLIKIGLDRKIPEVFRIALVPGWTSDEEAQEIMFAFLGFADKYACVRALRVIAGHVRQNDARITEEIRTRLTACAGDQAQYLKRRI